MTSAALAAAEEAVAAAPNDGRAVRLRDSLAEQAQKTGEGSLTLPLLSLPGEGR